MAERLHAGEYLDLDQSLWSTNGVYRLVLQADGNLVLYDDRGTLWASDTEGQRVDTAIMQEDGNFVLQAGARAVWASGTDGYPGARLMVQDDGNVVVYAQGGDALWATGTA